MYLSQLALEIGNPSTQQALRNCHDMHRNLMRAFDESALDLPRTGPALLYTLTSIGGKPALYVLSRECPDWSRVKGVRCYDERVPKCIDSLREKLTPGRRLRFTLLASPTKKTPREGKLSARVFLREEAERKEWMQRQAEKAGFAMLHMQEKEQRQIAGMRQGAPIHYAGVLFSGVLEIVYADRFWDAYCDGIGPGKAYGLGMLLIGRA